jgi:hypothetical protein
LAGIRLRLQPSFVEVTCSSPSTKAKPAENRVKSPMTSDSKPRSSHFDCLINYRTTVRPRQGYPGTNSLPVSALQQIAPPVSRRTACNECGRRSGADPGWRAGRCSKLTWHDLKPISWDFQPACASAYCEACYSGFMGDLAGGFAESGVVFGFPTVERVFTSNFW